MTTRVKDAAALYRDLKDERLVDRCRDRLISDTVTLAGMLRGLPDAVLVMMVEGAGAVDATAPTPAKRARRQRPPSIPETQTEAHFPERETEATTQADVDPSADPYESADIVSGLVSGMVLRSASPVSIGDILAEYPELQRESVSRALSRLALSGRVVRSGSKRGTRYAAPDGARDGGDSVQ